jgi:alpha-galactosidase
MSRIPAFLLRGLYVGGSLCNSPEGCQFALRNRIGSGTVTRFHGLEVDGIQLPPAALVVHLPDGMSIPAGEITPQSPVSLPAGLALSLRLPGLTLQPGKHELRFRFHTQELGELELRVNDTVRSEPERQEPIPSSFPASQVTDQEHLVPVPLCQPSGPESEASGPESEASGPESQPLGPGSPLASASSRPIKVAILGAGSAVFARQLMVDLLCTPGLERGTFALVDIDEERLELAQQIGEKLVQLSGRHWTVEATTNRLLALPGCDYIINSIEVAGLRNVRPDYDIPLKYGVDQCIGDTIGPGGIFKMLRTGPTWLEILRDAERLSPQALVMNYTNPMSALTLLALRSTPLQVVGLCHSVQGTSSQLAGYLDVPYEELRWRCAGINHLAWFTELTHQGEDMYPRLREAARTPDVYDADPVRFEMMLHFGAFVTESSGHFSEYVPYFRKRPDLLKRYMRPGYRGESGFYANNWPRWRAEADDKIRAQLSGKSPIILHRSSEYASTIIEAVETGSPVVIHGNVLNAALIDNLPAGGCVEVPVVVDATGLHPTYFGPLPPQLAALDAAHVYVHELLVQAVQERDREAAFQALVLDPLTAAVCSPDEVRSMFEEMWQAERDDLAVFEA